MTPMLIFMGVPPAVAVGTQSAQILASSVSGVLANLRRRAVDLQDGLGPGGRRRRRARSRASALFRLLMALGQIDLFVSLAYVLFLGTIGALMLVESLGAMLRSRLPAAAAAACTSISGCMAGRSRCAFPNSRLYISVLMPLRSAPSAACSPPCWASAAGSSWCRR